MDRDDVELLLRLKDGDTAAFAGIVDRFERRLIGYFYAMSSDRQVAEDCAQEVFLRVYRSREHYTPDASAATFIFRIARNYWIDRYRSKRSRATESSLEIDDPDEREERSTPMHMAAADRPDSRVEGAEDEVRLELALETLSPAQRSVIELGVRQGLRYEEVAAILGIPVGTVKSRVHAAIGALRRAMGAPELDRSS
jgi:RNA polymerase sigma-70 factor (ECF subfamily)